MDDNVILDKLITIAVDLGAAQSERKEAIAALEKSNAVLVHANDMMASSKERTEDLSRVAANDVAEARRERDHHCAMHVRATNALTDLVAAVDGVLISLSKTRTAGDKRALGILRDRANAAKTELMKDLPFG